eukprot:3041310-Rhodomonas_salina.1
MLNAFGVLFLFCAIYAILAVNIFQDRPNNARFQSFSYALFTVLFPTLCHHLFGAMLQSACLCVVGRMCVGIMASAFCCCATLNAGGRGAQMFHMCTLDEWSSTRPTTTPPLNACCCSLDVFRRRPWLCRTQREAEQPIAGR